MSLFPLKVPLGDGEARAMRVSVTFTLTEDEVARLAAAEVCRVGSLDAFGSRGRITASTVRHLLRRSLRRAALHSLSEPPTSRLFEPFRLKLLAYLRETK